MFEVLAKATKPYIYLCDTTIPAIPIKRKNFTVTTHNGLSQEALFDC